MWLFLRRTTGFEWIREEGPSAAAGLRRLWPRFFATSCATLSFAVPHSFVAWTALALARTLSSYPAGYSQRLCQSPLGHALRTGPLSPLLNIDLRAELRFDVRRNGSAQLTCLIVRLVPGFIHWPWPARPPNINATPPPCYRAGPTYIPL
jgi:hypothetical protein